jgi:hypothetical protein
MATTCPTQLPSGRHEASGRSTKVPAIPLPDDERLSNYGVPGLPEDSESKRLLQRKLTATATTAVGQNPNASRTLACQLPPAADMLGKERDLVGSAPWRLTSP